MLRETESAATGRGATQRRGWAPQGAWRGGYPQRADSGLQGPRIEKGRADPGLRRGGFSGAVTISALEHFSSRDSEILISTAQHPRVQMLQKVSPAE